MDLYITEEEFRDLLNIDKNYSVPKEAIIDYQKAVIGSYLMHEELFDKNHVIWEDERGDKLDYFFGISSGRSTTWRGACILRSKGLNTHVTSKVTRKGVTFSLETVFDKVIDFMISFNKKYSKKYGVRYDFTPDPYWSHTYLIWFHGLEVDNLPLVFDKLDNKKFVPGWKVKDSITNMQDIWLGDIKPEVSKIIENFKNTQKS